MISAKEEFQHDKIAEAYEKLKNGEFKPDFIKNFSKLEIPTSTAVCAALYEVKRNLELSLIKKTFTRNGHFDTISIMQLIRDLNYVHSYLWKIEQDLKNGR